MPVDLSPEQLFDLLKRDRLGSVYLFYGPGEFRVEKALSEIREALIPESARDFNLQIFDGAETVNAADIIDAARSLPFLASKRLIIVRRTDSFAPSALEFFVSYLDDPAPSTCLVFISEKADFRKEFYKKIRAIGGSVHFKPLYDRQVVPWLRRFAEELGLNITDRACAYLQGMVGNRLRDLYSEMEKLHLRYGSNRVGEAEIKDLAINSRMYTIFELMDQISLRRHDGSLSVLNRYLEKEGRDAAFGIIGMLNRQIRLIIQIKSITEKGVSSPDAAKKLHVHPFLANKLIDQARKWSVTDLESAFFLLYQADKRLKSGSQPRLVLDHLLLSL